MNNCLETTNKQFNERLMTVFRSSGMDAAVAPSAYGRAAGAAEKDRPQSRRASLNLGYQGSD